VPKRDKIVKDIINRNKQPKHAWKVFLKRD
jgi:hypothetical protein